MEQTFPHGVLLAPPANRVVLLTIVETAMNARSPALAPVTAGQPSPAGLQSQDTASQLSATPIPAHPLSPTDQAANDGTLVDIAVPPSGVTAPFARKTRMPLLIALVAGFWTLGTVILVTLTLATRLVA